MVSKPSSALQLKSFDPEYLRAQLLDHYGSHFRDLLSHSVEKMFEEAELSGVLVLTGRKLKEFPSDLAAKYDISDVIFADLSENRLNELPGCICDLCFLETLRVRSAGIKVLPCSFHLLTSLTYLDLSCNRLATLPTALCSLRLLQVLLLTGNLLETLPREIRQLADALNELDVSCNRLRAVPADLALLKSLRVLNLRANHLTHLPSELSRLNLRVFNIAENQLTELPFDFCHMSSLVDFRVEGNPLISPPVAICAKGREHIFKWLRTKATSSSDGFVKQNEWLHRPASVAVNTTMPRKKQADTFYVAEEELYFTAKRGERRSRSTRFNTLGGSDSGYASTVDEHRHSSEYQIPGNNGSLFGISESLRSSFCDRNSSKSTGDASSGDRTITSGYGNTVPEGSSGLLKEVMLAYAEKMAATTAESAQESTTTPLRGRTILQNGRCPETSFSLQSSLIMGTPVSSLTHPQVTRPQAVVSPMNSKPLNSPQVLSDAENEVLKAIEKDDIAEISDDLRLVKEARLVARGENTSLDESNNNIITMPSSESPISRFARDSSKSVASMTAADIKSVYTGKMQRAPVKKRTENVETAVVLSPVIEVPSFLGTSFENVNVTEDNCECPATCVNLSPTSSEATTVCCASSVESVSSTVKVLSVKTTNTSSGSADTQNNSATNAASIQNRTGNASKRGTASRRSVVPPHGVSRVAPTHNPVPTPTLSHSKGTKLSKARDSIGITRSHMANNINNNNNNNVMRKSVFGSSRTQIDDNSNATTSSYSVVAKRSIENMRKALESRLETVLPNDKDQLAASLADGTLLCNFANQIRLRCIPTVLTSPSPSVPLSLLKCRRNVENFLTACRRTGVSEASLCQPNDILDQKNLPQVAKTVLALNKFASSFPRRESRRITNV